MYRLLPRGVHIVPAPLVWYFWFKRFRVSRRNKMGDETDGVISPPPNVKIFCNSPQLAQLNQHNLVYV